MITLSSFDKIYLYSGYVDFRKSINGLSAIVQEEMKLDLFSKYLFVFTNKPRDKIKVLYWDKSGFALWLKRLEESKFQWLKKSDEISTSIDEQQLRLLLDGYDIWKMKPHKKLEYKHVF